MLDTTLDFLKVNSRPQLQPHRVRKVPSRIEAELGWNSIRSLVIQTHGRRQKGRVHGSEIVTSKGQKSIMMEGFWFVN